MSKKNKKNQDANKQELQWKVKEYEKHQHSRNWYIIAGIIATALLVYAIWTHNYFFALIIIISAFLLVFNDQEEPGELDVYLKNNGINVGKKFYEYNDFANFYIIYRPGENIKNLYFVFKNPVSPRLSINLDKMNPLTVRNHLTKYLKEDLEKENIPLSEGLAKILKL